MADMPIPQLNSEIKRVYLSESLNKLDFSKSDLRLGLLGGSFNPPHLGHVWMGELFSTALNISKILLMPTLTPPHKINPDMASAENRAEMCRLISRENEVFAVSTLEINRGDVSFTVDTIGALLDENPARQLFLLVGADMFSTLRSWKNADVIFKNAVICTLPRDGVNFDALVDYGKKIEAAGGRVVILDVLEKEISSTSLRKLIGAGEDVSSLVSKPVFDFIQSRRLYQKPTADDGDILSKIPIFTEIVKGRLSEKRFYHSIKVAEKAAELAEKYGCSNLERDKAYLAGILHDIFKETDRQTQLQIFEDFDIISDNPCLNKSFVCDNHECEPYLHAFSGAAFVKYVLKLDDEAIISAINYHTTGKADMSLLEKLVFVADYTSADRSYPDIAIARKLALESLDDAIIYCLSYTIRDLVKRRKPVHLKSVEAYNYLIEKAFDGCSV